MKPIYVQERRHYAGTHNSLRARLFLVAMGWTFLVGNLSGVLLHMFFVGG